MAGKKDQERKKIQYTNPKERAEKHSSGFESTSIRLPEGVKFFSIKSAKPVKIDILPYLVQKGRGEKGGNPYSDAGHLHYERTYFCHKGIGIEQNAYVCPRKTFGKKCPICEAVGVMRRDPKADGDLVKSLEPKERQLFAVLDKSDEDQNIKVMDMSNFLFGKVLDAKLRDADEDDGYENFYRLDEGFTLKLSIEEKSFAGRSFYAVNNIEMKVRPEALPDELLDEVPDLDSLLIEVPYDRLKAIFEGDEEEGDDEDVKPKKKTAAKDADDDDEDADPVPTKKPKAPPGRPAKKAKPEPEEEEEEDGVPAMAVGDVVNHDEFGVCEIKKILEGGEKANIEDEYGKLLKAVWLTDLTPVPEEEEEEEEVKPKKAKAPVDEEEDDWETTDDDEDEKPKKKGKK